MGKVVIAIYRPKEGKEKELLELVTEEHMQVLRSQDLVTGREPVVMRASDGAIIEIFEWKSAEAVGQAHTNPEVAKLWEKFSAVSDYEIPININEFHNPFSEFEPIN